MRIAGMTSLLLPIARAVVQLDEPSFQRVFLASIAWSIASFVVMYVAAIWIIHRVLNLHGWLAWIADFFGSVGTSLLALWLFLPVAAAIGTMFSERVAISVERRFYPRLPQPQGVSFLGQAWDGLVVALKVFGLNIVALIPALVFPGIGFLVGWMIAAYAIGRGLFVAVAMRRMQRMAADSLYRASRGIVLSLGAILALMTYIPILNLLIPIIGVAAMVHVLNLALPVTETPRGR